MKDLYVIVNDSKVDVLEDIIKKYNLQGLKSLKQTGGWDDDPKKKAQAKGEIYLTKELKQGRKGKAFELVISRFDPSSIFVPSNNKESIEYFGKTKVLLELEYIKDLNKESLIQIYNKSKLNEVVYDKYP